MKSGQTYNIWKQQHDIQIRQAVQKLEPFKCWKIGRRKKWRQQEISGTTYWLPPPTPTPHDSAVARHSDDSEDDVVVISYKPTSLKQDEELGNSLEFYFQYSGSVDEVINIKFLRKDFFCFVSFLLNNKKGTEKECYYKNIMNSYNFSNI